MEAKGKNIRKKSALKIDLKHTSIFFLYFFISYTILECVNNGNNRTLKHNLKKKKKKSLKRLNRFDKLTIQINSNKTKRIKQWL